MKIGYMAYNTNIKIGPQVAKNYNVWPIRDTEMIQT